MKKRYEVDNDLHTCIQGESEMLRSVALLIWAGLIFLLTCTESMEQLLQQGMITFTWRKFPNWDEFWYPLPTTLDATFISRKLGHSLSFFILSLLILFVTLSKQKMLVISLFYSIATEVLQLFFNRGGRLFDIGFDGLGVAAALIIVISIPLVQEKSLTKSSQT
jgi:VanZ family protein